MESTGFADISSNHYRLEQNHLMTYLSLRSSNVWLLKKARDCKQILEISKVWLRNMLRNPIAYPKLF